MMEAAVAWYQATGERKLLDVMLRFAHHIHDVLGKEPGKIPGVRATRKLSWRCAACTT